MMERGMLVMETMMKTILLVIKTMLSLTIRSYSSLTYLFENGMTDIKVMRRRHNAYTQPYGPVSIHDVHDIRSRHVTHTDPLASTTSTKSTAFLHSRYK